MATINHKEEVLKVYPDAVCNYEFYSQIGQWGYEIVTPNKILAYLNITENEAWESAYNNIKNQKK